MSAADDARKVASALRMIAKGGKTVTVSREVVGTYDTATGTVSSSTAVSADVKAIVKDFQPRIGQLSLLVKSGDKELTFAAKDFDAPKIGDTFTIDGVTYTVVPRQENGLEVETVYAGELPALYHVHGRKS